MTKKLLYVGTLSLLLSSCSYQRIGDLTMISNRNIDSGEDYVLIERDVEGKARIKNDNDALETALEEVTEEHEGEYLMNAKIYIRSDGDKIKVKGDVWGLKSVHVDVESSVTQSVKLEIGDTVAFEKGRRLVEGTILGINAEAAVIEFKNIFGKMKKKEVPFDELTKIDKS